MDYIFTFALYTFILSNKQNKLQYICYINTLDMTNQIFRHYKLYKMVKGEMMLKQAKLQNKSLRCRVNRLTELTTLNS